MVVLTTLLKVANAGICNGKCDDPQPITCTSINTFQRCVGDGTALSPVTIACPKGFSCSSTSDDWCVKSDSTSDAIDCENACDGVCPPSSGAVVFDHKCIGRNKYRLCSSLFPIDRECPSGQICTPGNKCVSPNGNTPVCSN